MSWADWAGRHDVVGHITPIGPVEVFGTGGFGFGAYSWTGYPGSHRLFLGNDKLVHVLNMSLDHSLYSEIYWYRTRLVDYSCKPSEACSVGAVWNAQYSPSITRDPLSLINGLGGIVYGPMILMAEPGVPWISIADWWMGNTSRVGYMGIGTVDFATGFLRVLSYGGTYNRIADIRSYVPVVIDGKRFYVAAGSVPPDGWAYYGPVYFGYFQVDSQGNVLNDVHIQTGSFAAWNPMSGYVARLVSAWARGSSLEFALWDPDEANLMRIYRVDNPLSGETWHEVGNCYVTPGAGIDSLRLMDDGSLCFVLSVAGNKHLLWWDGSTFSEDFLGLTTSDDDVNFYTGIFGGPNVGQLRLFSGTKKSCQGVFGFRYQDQNNPLRWHVGIKVATISGTVCTTKTLYHTMLDTLHYGDDAGWALTSPSVLKLPGGQILFCFAAANQYLTDGVYTDCIVESGEQSNAIWYGE